MCYSLLRYCFVIVLLYYFVLFVITSVFCVLVVIDLSLSEIVVSDLGISYEFLHKNIILVIIIGAHRHERYHNDYTLSFLKFEFFQYLTADFASKRRRFSTRTKQTTDALLCRVNTKDNYIAFVRFEYCIFHFKFFDFSFS